MTAGVSSIISKGLRYDERFELNMTTVQQLEEVNQRTWHNVS